MPQISYSEVVWGEWRIDPIDEDMLGEIDGVKNEDTSLVLTLRCAFCDTLDAVYFCEHEGETQSACFNCGQEFDLRSGSGFELIREFEIDDVI